jgi:hypothetical protein
MREPTWPRPGLMCRLLLATSSTLFVFSGVLPTSLRGGSCCCSGFCVSFSDATSVRQAHAFLRRRDRKELTREVMGTPSCARGTRASLAALRRQMPLQLRGGDGGGGGRDRDMRDREASRGSHPGNFNSPGGTRKDAQCAGPCNRGGPLGHQRCQQGGSNGKRLTGKCITPTTMTAQRIGRCRVRLELSFRGPTSARARIF